MTHTNTKSKMIKKFIVSLCILWSVTAIAQRGSSSSYSFYGIGEERFKGSTENRAMGSLSIFPDSTHVNLQNPAGYGGLKLTTLSLSASHTSTNAETNTQTGRSKNTTIDYLNVGIPLSPKWGAGVGLVAYSAVGYQIQNQTTISENFSTSNQFEGSGGVNRVFFSSGYRLTPNFSIGATMDYNFGRIETSALEFQQLVQFGTQELNTSQVSGFSFNLGGMWEKKINAKHKVYFSGYYTPESTLSFSNTRSIATVQFSTISDPVIIDEQLVNVADTEVKLPSRVAIGAGFGQERKWLLGAEFTVIQSNTLQNRFADITNASFENSKRISVGGYYIPQYNSFSSYFERITFRGGFRHENTGLVVNNKAIDDTAVTFGVGLPVPQSFSNVNLGVELGRRGTAAANLVRENYINFTVSFSLNDKWFVKRKYN